MPSPIMWDLVSQLDRKELPCKWLWVSDLPPASALPRHLSPPIPTSIHLSFILRPHSPPPYPSPDLHTAFSLQHSEFTKTFGQRYNHPWSDTDCDKLVLCSLLNDMIWDIHCYRFLAALAALYLHWSFIHDYQFISINAALARIITSNFLTQTSWRL